MGVQVVLAAAALALLALILLARRLLAGRLAGGIAAALGEGEWVGSALGDALPHLRTVRGGAPRRLPEDLRRELAETGRVHLPPGVHELRLESFCLDLGKHVPSGESPYLIAPLRGRRAAALRHLLAKAAKAPDVSREQVQTLIWSLATGGYRGMTPDLRLLAERLLPEADLLLLGKNPLAGVPGPLRDWVMAQARARLPREVLAALAAFEALRARIADAGSTYEEIERLAVRFGRPPAPADPPAVCAGEWSLTERGHFLRALPDGYRATRLQVYVPEPREPYFERDAAGRITRMGVRGGPEVRIAFADPPEGSDLALPGGGSLPVRRFRRLTFTAPASETADGTAAFEVEAPDNGWVPRDPRALAALDPERHPELAGRIRAAGDNLADAAALAAALRRGAARGRRGRQEEGGDPVPEGERGDPIDEITDVKHYLNGIEAVLEDLRQGVAFREKLEWLADHVERLLRAWDHAVALLARAAFGSGGGPHAPGEPPPPDAFPCPTDLVAVPANPNEQRLAFTCRPG